MATTNWRNYPLGTRLYLDRHLWEMARFVGHSGKTEGEFAEFCARHKAEHGEARTREAILDLTTTEKGSRRVVLRPEAVRAARVLLGPPPGAPEYEDYWRKRGEAPTEEPMPAPKPEHKKRAKK